jgi:hypothetical protein
MEADSDNVTIVAKRWEEAEVNPADVVISAMYPYQGLWKVSHRIRGEGEIT